MVEVCMLKSGTAIIHTEFLFNPQQSQILQAVKVTF